MAEYDQQTRCELIMYGYGEPAKERQVEAVVGEVEVDPLFLTVYGAGTFLLAAKDEVEVTAATLRNHGEQELAFALVMPLSPEAAKEYRQANCLPDNFKGRVPERYYWPKQQLPKPDRNQGLLFRVKRHGKTGKMLFNY